MLERCARYNYFAMIPKKTFVSVGAVLGLFVVVAFFGTAWMEATSNWEVAEEHRCFLQDHPSRRSLVDLAVAPMDSSLMCFCRLINVRATFRAMWVNHNFFVIFPLFPLRLENLRVAVHQLSLQRFGFFTCFVYLSDAPLELREAVLSLQSDFAVPDSRIAKMALRLARIFHRSGRDLCWKNSVPVHKLLHDTCQNFSEDVRIDPLVGLFSTSTEKLATTCLFQSFFSL